MCCLPPPNISYFSGSGGVAWSSPGLLPWVSQATRKSVSISVHRPTICSLNISPAIFNDTSTIRLLKGRDHKDLQRFKGTSRQKVSFLEAVVHTNDHTSWDHPLQFSAHFLPRGGQRWSLASTINKQIREEADPSPAVMTE